MECFYCLDKYRCGSLCVCGGKMMFRNEVRCERRVERIIIVVC